MRLKELITLSILIALGGADSQVKGHLRGNLNFGNGRDLPVDVISRAHQATYEQVARVRSGQEKKDRDTTQQRSIPKL
jgi:alkylhydroperoxidase/carboxymuconolactone decarboxylase family protein YurZ